MTVTNTLDQSIIRRIRRSMKKWYERQQRQLPWRNDRRQPRDSETEGALREVGRTDPYHVLVSESMLQQTQVATVIDYFKRFIEHLPTVQSCANADEKQVLCLWKGLGYYRRALNLHAAAKVIVRDYGGQLPGKVDTLMRLPGVGRYTAGAIASIAFERPSPILDGNVARVLARLLAIQEPIDALQTRDLLWQIAGMLVPHTRPGDFNQVLMELGALIYTPRRPKCLNCPVAADCRAKATGQTDRLPIRLVRPVPTYLTPPCRGLQERQILLRTAPPKGLWPSMWQMPTAEHLRARVEPKRVQSWISNHLGLESSNRGVSVNSTTERPTDRFGSSYGKPRCERAAFTAVPVSGGPLV